MQMVATGQGSLAGGLWFRGKRTAIRGSRGDGPACASAPAGSSQELLRLDDVPLSLQRHRRGLQLAMVALLASFGLGAVSMTLGGVCGIVAWRHPQRPL